MALILAVLFAVLWQSFVVGAYGHAHRAAASMAQVTAPHGGAVAHGHRAASGDEPGRQESDDCPICREITHDGVFLLPEIAAVHAPEPETLWRATRPTAHADRSGRSHAWRSRAPPQILQA